MNTILLHAKLMDGVARGAEFGLNWMVQSTLLLIVGFGAAWLLRGRGSAVQSAVYRTTLAAVLVCPLVTWMLALAGVSGCSIELPEAWTRRGTPEISAGTSEEPAVAARGTGASDFVVAPSQQQSPEALALPGNYRPSRTTGGPSAASAPISRAASPQFVSSAASREEQTNLAANRFGLIATVFCLLWLIVTAVLLTRLAGAWRQLSRIRHSAAEAEPATVATCREVASLMKLAPPEVKYSPYLPSPCLAGIRRPVVLLPEAFETMSLRDTLIHELAHLRRRDCHWSLLARLATAVFFFQPLLWRLSRQLDTTAEEVCDDYVVHLGSDRQEYAHRLVDLAALSSTSVAAAAVGVISHKSMLARRVARITDMSRRQSTRAGGLLLMPILVGGLLITTAAGLVGVQSQVGNRAALNEGPASDRDGHAGGDQDVVIVRGQVVDSDGNPVAGAQVAAIAQRIGARHTDRHAPGSRALAEATTDERGHYRMSFPRTSPRAFGFGNVVASAERSGLVWQKLSLQATEVEASFSLPREQLARARLVDADGQPASHVELSIRSVIHRVEGNTRADSLWADFASPPRAWLRSVVTDDQGRFTIRGVPAGYGVGLTVDGDNRFAPQDLLLSSGLPEERGERDGTYRSQIKNVGPGGETVFTLAPARFFEGVVRYADTGDPVPHAQVSVWASQQETDGSMSSVGGRADAEGNYRISPEPGVRFGLMAYPPAGEPYLIRQIRDLRWKEGETTQRVGLTLPRGVLVRGTVIEAGTKAPIANAAVQYVPERKNNPHVRSETVTGWQDIRLSDEQGRFAIAVLPGPGRLIVHGPANDYVIRESSSRQLSRGTSGGPRVYAHCIENIEPDVAAEPLDVTLSLQRCPAMTGTLVDEQGQPVAEATMISRLIIHPYWLEWNSIRDPILGGQFQIAGLPAGKQCPVHFLDAKRRLGATVTFKAGTDLGNVVLKPCGRATMRFVDSKGQPVANYRPHVQIVVTPGVDDWGQFGWLSWNLGMPMADADFISNSDMTNYSSFPGSDPQGRLTLPVLIPGATYNVHARKSGQPGVKRVTVTAGETLDLGDLVVDRPK